MQTSKANQNEMTTKSADGLLQSCTKQKKQPPYHVVLLNDNDHTYDYVIDMIRKLFGYPAETAFRMAGEVDRTGRVVLDTTTMERAELKRDQIHAFGRDWRIQRCEGSMSSLIEPAAS